MDIFYSAFYKKGMFGVKTCVHQDQPQLYNLFCFIRQSLRNPSDPGKTQAPGEQILFHRYRRVVANRKWSNPQGNTKRTENQKAKPSRKKMDFQETDFHLSWSQAKMSNQNGGSATVNNHTVYSCPVLKQACRDLTHP